jgi:hypothetical protein
METTVTTTAAAAAQTTNETLLPSFDSYISNGKLLNAINPNTEGTSGAAYEIELSERLQNALRAGYPLGQLIAIMALEAQGAEKANRALRTVRDFLMTEASERGWCSEFDQFINSVNRHLEDNGLGDYVLEERTQEYEIEIEIRGTLTTFVTQTVAAQSPEEAFQMASEKLNTDRELTDAARTVTFDDIEIVDWSVL